MNDAYDTQFTPPAPVLMVVLRGLVRQRPRMQLPALIDTGADITAVPERAIQQLNLYAIGRLALEGMEARPSLVDLYSARLTYADLPTREMEVVPGHYPFVILGRDWLAPYYLLLNGPQQNFLLRQTPFVILD